VSTGSVTMTDNAPTRRTTGLQVLDGNPTVTHLTHAATGSFLRRNRRGALLTLGFSDIRSSRVTTL
jgi:hypothetical protein